MLIPILDDVNLRDDTNNLVLPQEIVIKDTVENNGRENDEILSRLFYEPFWVHQLNWLTTINVAPGSQF